MPDPDWVSYLTRTTLAGDETAEIVDAPRAGFPKLRGPGPDGICYASTNRQDALAAARDVDLVLVIGSANSLRLAELIDDSTGIRPEWMAGGVVGLTVGASAPPHLTGTVLDARGGLGPISVSERETATETMSFALSMAVRP
jgi:4-hydroxy-3-methylbut-2-en-1-yl diphosphate reductase